MIKVGEIARKISSLLRQQCRLLHQKDLDAGNERLPQRSQLSMSLDTVLNTLHRQGLACDKQTLIFVLKELESSAEMRQQMSISEATNQVKLDNTLVEALAQNRPDQSSSQAAEE